MDSVTLKRGSREVTFKKLPSHFAVRLKQGRAKDEPILEACCGRPITAVTHIDSAGPEKMDIFAVDEAKKLEETIDKLREATASDVITHMYSLDDTPGSAVIPVGTMTIQFKPDISMAKREEILAEFGLEIIEELDFLPHGYTVKLTQASKENPLKITATQRN